jgi:hypothetical protein
MSQIIIFGDVGTGKTLLAAIMAIHDSRKVLANFEIKIDRWSMLEPQMLNDIHEPTLVIIDEAYSWLESRMSGNAINRYLSYCLFQSRKRQVDFVLTAQLLSTLDLRFKNMADVYIVAERNRKGFVYTVVYPGRRGRKVLTMSLETASKYWDKYDTMQLINPIDDELLYKVTPDKSSVLPTIDGAIEDLIKERPANEWTKGMVSDFCLDKMFPHSYVELIYNRLKRKYVRDEDAEA